jgi:hypothetical protein
MPCTCELACYCGGKGRVEMDRCRCGLAYGQKLYGPKCDYCAFGLGWAIRLAEKKRTRKTIGQLLKEKDMPNDTDRQTLTVATPDLATVVAGLVREGLGFKTEKLANGDYLIKLDGSY